MQNSRSEMQSIRNAAAAAWGIRCTRTILYVYVAASACLRMCNAHRAASVVSTGQARQLMHLECAKMRVSDAAD